MQRRALGFQILPTEGGILTLTTSDMCIRVDMQSGSLQTQDQVSYTSRPQGFVRFPPFHPRMHPFKSPF